MSGAALCFLLPILASALRFRTDSSSETSTGSSLGFDRLLQAEFQPYADGSVENTLADFTESKLLNTSNSSNLTQEWPDRWAKAHAIGNQIANQLDEATLINFVHAKSDGNVNGSYTAQTMALPQYGIPSLKMQRCNQGWEARTKDEKRRVTAMPSYFALASTWDQNLVADVALAISEEFTTLGANAMLGPNINIHRNTQHDEEFDSLSGEDPTLGSVLVRAWILAAQTHGMMTIPSALGKTEQASIHMENSLANTTTWDIYYPPFETAIDVGAAGVTCASHEVNGLWACRDKDMLERDLRGIMKFQGMVVSESNTGRDYFQYASSFERGLDLAIDEPIVTQRSAHELKGLRRAAARTIAAIWHMRAEMRPGCVPPFCTAELARIAATPQHRIIARKAAASSIVLLKNEGVLPFTNDTTQTLAIFGPFANLSLENADFESPMAAISFRAALRGITVIDDPAAADGCVVLGGSHSRAAHWIVNSSTLNAIELAKQKCKKVAVLLEVSGAVLLKWRDGVGAIAAVFHAGEGVAFGWSAMLFGEASPSGKLPISFPDYNENTPNWWEEQPPSYWEAGNFVFPFGHGLSYANFKYSDMKWKKACHFPLCIMVTVTNTNAKYSGSEVVQVYFKFDKSTNHPTVLRAFHKTRVLAPGESEKVFFPFSLRDISLYRDIGGQAVEEDSWVMQRNITVLVGPSSKDLPLSMNVKPKF